MKFTLGTVSSNLYMSETYKLLKCSLLYADEVELIGIAEYALYQYFPRIEDDSKDLEGLVNCLTPLLKSIDSVEAQTLATQCEEIKQMLEFINPHLKKKKYRTKNEILAQQKIRQLEKECRTTIETCFDDILNTPESQDIRRLVDSSIVSVFDYGFDGLNLEEMTGGYFANLIGTMKHRMSYPLFDEMSADLVSALITDNMIIDISKTQKEILRHAGVAVEVLKTLPTLDSASVDEIIDFKKSMKKPLASFRSAIFEFSEKVESMPWDKDFKYECIKLYYNDILPCVNEINELASDTSVLKNFGSKVLSDGEMRRKIGFVGAGLAASVTTGLNMSNALGLIEQIVRWGGKIGLSAAAIDAFLKTADLMNQAHKEVAQTKAKLENNVMYYYYLASHNL